MYDDPDGVLLRLFRASHAASVVSASPLALDLIASSGLTSDRLAMALTFDADWPPWLCGRRPLGARRFAHRRKGRTSQVPSEADHRCAFLNGGLVIRRGADPAGQLGVRLSRASFEVAGRLGSRACGPSAGPRG